MFERKRFTWSAQIADEVGQVLEVPIVTYWDPEKIPSFEVAVTAAAEATHAVRGERRFIPISAVLVTS